MFATISHYCQCQGEDAGNSEKQMKKRKNELNVINLFLSTFGMILLVSVTRPKVLYLLTQDYKISTIYFWYNFLYMQDASE